MLRKATRKQAKIRLGFSGVAGGGKTYSALLTAFGLCDDWSKIAVIDTENGSADLYSHLGDYNVLPLKAPFEPERYIAAITECEKAGMAVIIIDSITHEWDGKGGCLEIVDKITQASAAKNSYFAWGRVTPRHQAFIDAIIQSPCHVITTVRRKQDYETGKDTNGKLRVEKAGTKEVTREGFEYELTINLQIDETHHAHASKDRTGLFMDKPEFIPSVETGKIIKAWCEEGEPEEEIDDAWYEVLDQCTNLQEVIHLYQKNKKAVDESPKLQHLFSNRKHVLNGATATVG